MQYEQFIGSLEQDNCPEGLRPCQQALWYDAKGQWNRAHEIVQQSNDTMAARIHAYLHRKEGDEWNARYWYRRAASQFPENKNLRQEWDALLRELTDNQGAPRWPRLD